MSTDRTQDEDNPDAALLAMIARHDELWAEWDRLTQDHDPGVSALSEECEKLEPRIIATPAHTEEGLAGKRRVIKITRYAGRAGHPEQATGDVTELVDAILEMDAARIVSAV